MKPYYSDELVTLYLGDCRELQLERDCVVTDPPYGINARQRDHSGSWHEADGPVLEWDAEYPHDYINAQVAQGGPVLAFGSSTTIAREYQHFIEIPRLLIWAPRFRLGMAAKDGLVYRYHPIYAFGLRVEGPAVRDVLTYPTPMGSWWNHPATKPVPLMTDLVSMTSGVVLDPFAGSGSTLVAAKSLGRQSIGVELSEQYAEIAAQRCSQGVLGLELE